MSDISYKIAFIWSFANILKSKILRGSEQFEEIKLPSDKVLKIIVAKIVSSPKSREALGLLLDQFIDSNFDGDVSLFVQAHMHFEEIYKSHLNFTHGLSLKAPLNFEERSLELEKEVQLLP
jgi:hypothetical protein